MHEQVRHVQHACSMHPVVVWIAVFVALLKRPQAVRHASLWQAVLLQDIRFLWMRPEQHFVNVLPSRHLSALQVFHA